MAGSISRTIIQTGRLLRSRNARLALVHDWRRQLAGEPALPERRIGCVLVLCHGNICRSPFAAAYLAERSPDLEVRSSGLAAGEAAPADPTAVRVAARYGHDLSQHRSRPLGPEDLELPDLVLVMEASQAAAFRGHAPALAERVHLLGDFLATRPFGIPDPWGCSEAVFDRTFAQIAAALDRLMQRLQDRPT
jgi:protein-tyrosine phosphatase